MRVQVAPPLRIRVGPVLAAAEPAAQVISLHVRDQGRVAGLPAADVGRLDLGGGRRQLRPVADRLRNQGGQRGVRRE